MLPDTDYSGYGLDMSPQRDYSEKIEYQEKKPRELRLLSQEKKYERKERKDQKSSESFEGFEKKKKKVRSLTPLHEESRKK